MKVLMVSIVMTFTVLACNGQSEDRASIYFIRSTGMQGWAVPFVAFIDDQPVCKLNNNKFSVHEVMPGEHKITVQFSGKSAKKKAEQIYIETEVGKIYYIQMIIKSGAFINNLYPQEVTKNSAELILKKCEKDLCL